MDIYTEDLHLQKIKMIWWKIMNQRNLKIISKNDVREIKITQLVSEFMKAYKLPIYENPQLIEKKAINQYLMQITPLVEGAKDYEVYAIEEKKPGSLKGAKLIGVYMTGNKIHPTQVISAQTNLRNMLQENYPNQKITPKQVFELKNSYLKEEGLEKML